MGTKSATKTISQAGRVVINQAVEQIQIFDENNLCRMIIGLLPDGTYGTAVSKPGIDVRLAF